jgi:hypothetical protein
MDEKCQSRFDALERRGTRKKLLAVGRRPPRFRLIVWIFAFFLSGLEVLLLVSLLGEADKREQREFRWKLSLDTAKAANWGQTRSILTSASNFRSFEASKLTANIRWISREALELWST